MAFAMILEGIVPHMCLTRPKEIVAMQPYRKIYGMPNLRDLIKA